jgi:hypothetical protein
MAVLTFGTVINLSPIFYVGRNVLKFYPNVEGKTITLRSVLPLQKVLAQKKFFLAPVCNPLPAD